MKTKKILSLVIVLSIILSLVVQGTGGVTASGKSLYASRYNVTMHKSTSVTITSKLGGSLYYTIGNKSVVSAKWGSWNGKKIKLKLTGKKTGTTTIKVKNKNTGASINIKVKVRLVKIKLPSCPITIRNYDFDGSVEDTVKITKISTKITYYSFCKPTVTVYLKGKKTYSSHGYYTSTMVTIPWKLYKNSSVIDSGEIITGSISTGETFNEKGSVFDVPYGTCKLKFLNYTW